MLSRRRLLSVPVVLALAAFSGGALSVAGGGAQAAAPTVAVPAAGFTPSAEDRVFMAKAEDYLGALKTLQARVLQITSTGSSIEGALAIKRPGRMNLTYDRPSQVKIVADGTWLIYVDGEVQQVTHLPLDSTPAGILLRDSLRFEDPDIRVVGVRRSKGVSEIDVVMASDPEAGTLTLVFAEAPFELRQWRVRDPQGIETIVSLFNIRTGVTFKNDLFVYTDLPGSDR